jgi:hypothetical protein
MKLDLVHFVGLLSLWLNVILGIGWWLCEKRKQGWMGLYFEMKDLYRRASATQEATYSLGMTSRDSATPAPDAK